MTLPLRPLARVVRGLGLDTWRFGAGLAPYGSNLSFRYGHRSISAISANPFEDPERYRRRVRHLEYVVDDPAAPIDERVGRLLAAPMVGTPVVGLDPASLADHLPGEVVAALTAASPASLTEREHAHKVAWRQRNAILDAQLLPLDTARRTTEPISVVVATNRPGMIELWASQLAAQTHPDVEVLVGLHGDGFSPAHRERIATMLAARPLEMIDVEAEAPLGVVLQRAGERASGTLISKWDDDDLYDRDHLAQMGRIWAVSGATLVGKAHDFAYLVEPNLTVHRRQSHRETFSISFAGGTMTLSRSDLDEVGGWPSLRAGVDVGLTRRVLDHGGSTYASFGYGYVMVRYPSAAASTPAAAVKGHRRHTWTANEQHFLERVIASHPGLDTNLAEVDSPGAAILTGLISPG